MITFTCNEENCKNKSIEYNFFGNDLYAECGSCKAVLTGTNQRPDPELPKTTIPITE